MRCTLIRRLRFDARYAPILAGLVLWLASPITTSAAPRSIHPALREISPGRAISERFLSRDKSGGVLVDLMIQGSVDPQLLRDRGIEVDTRVGRVMTARCPLPILSQLLELPGVERVEAAERCEPNLDVSAIDVGVSYLRVTPPLGFSGETGTGVLVGVVDTGIDYLHPDFQKTDGTTRLVSVWDQTGTGNPPPPGFGYGTEWLPSDLNGEIAGEIDSDGHGTHLMGIAAGNGSATGNGFSGFEFVGMAPQADLCVVKTTFQTTAIADGVNYIFQKAASLGKRAVVNLSLGTQAGPHDGTSTLDQLINGLTGPGKIVVASAGNEGTVHHHGQVAVSPGTPRSMTLTVPVYTKNVGSGNDFLLFSGWYEGADNISVTIRTPGNATLGPVAVGTTLLNQNTNDGLVNIFNGTTTPSNGDHEIYIEVFDGFANKPPTSGTWTFTFTPISLGSTGRVDMYLYDDHLGDGSLLATWDQGFVPGGVVGSPGDADSVICAAAHATKACWDALDGNTECWSPAPTLGEIAPFSSQGPRRDGVLKPDISAPGLGITSSLSASAPFPAARISADGMHVNISGTSQAAPHVAGAAALLLAQSCMPNAYPSQIKALLQATALSDAFTGTIPNPAWGFGKLNIAGALFDSMRPSVPHPAKGTNLPPGKPDSVTVMVTCVAADSVIFSLSTNGGSTYPIPLGALYEVRPGAPVRLSFLPTSSMSTSGAKVRAVAYKTGAALATSYSDSLFSILLPAAVEADATLNTPRFALEPNAPNPFNPMTTIRFEVDRTGPTTLRVYAVNGSLVRTLVSGTLPAGGYRVGWDGRDERGRAVGSGLYIYRLESGGRSLAAKMSLLR